VSRVRLFLSGDVMTGRGVDQVLPHSCPPRIYERYVTSAADYVRLAERRHGPIPVDTGYARVWGDALAELDRLRPDARIINLETSVTTCEHALAKGINYRMHPANAPVLTAAGIDCCVLANNHVLDWDESGLVETLATLELAGIHVAGAGRDLEAARAPAVLPAPHDTRVLVFGMAAGDSGVPASWAAGAAKPGVCFLRDFSARTVADIADRVRRTKRPGDVAVLSVHWGGNWGYEVPAAHREFAHAVIDDASVDVVHGHSSHHPKAVEVYRDRPIFYGCGDLLNDYEGIAGHDEFRADLVLLYLPTLEDGRLTALDMIPLRIRHFSLRRPPAADRAWLAATMDRECRRFGHGVVEATRGLALDLTP
jgi:poly-gamma-glutamate capsule biosynthesis protein CapA/YwtB (metallophosphatase superfamily)